VHRLAAERCHVSSASDRKRRSPHDPCRCAFRTAWAGELWWNPNENGIALRLKRIDILGGGSANLKTSEILFGYRVVRRVLSLSLLGLTSGPAVVSGTIDNPTAALDPEGLLIQAGAAMSTAGLSFLVGDLWRKRESSTDPCARIAAGAHSVADPLQALVRALPKLRLPKPVATKP
jgi:hypothetical protein